MGEWTGEPRWQEAARESAAALRARRGDDGLWRQDDDYRGLGTLHGVAGNTLVLLRLDADDALAAETAAVLTRHAFREDGLANWPGSPRPQLARPRDGRICLQWCTGAPGVLAGAWEYLAEDLLLAGAELIWRAGAHGDEKGHGICHGTSRRSAARTAEAERPSERCRLPFDAHGDGDAAPARDEEVARELRSSIPPLSGVRARTRLEPNRRLACGERSVVTGRRGHPPQRGLVVRQCRDRPCASGDRDGRSPAGLEHDQDLQRPGATSRGGRHLARPVAHLHEGDRPCEERTLPPAGTEVAVCAPSSNRRTGGSPAANDERAEVSAARATAATVPATTPAATTKPCLLVRISTEGYAWRADRVPTEAARSL